MSQHHHQMFPIDFLKDIIRNFNGVVKEDVLTASINQLDVKFKRTDHSNKSIFITLFAKLVEAFKTISEKYIGTQDLHTRVKMNIEDTETHFVIHISGIIYIPPGKIFNLFSLILWYFIRYNTGTKPANSEYGIKLTNEWKKEEKYLRFEINQSEWKIKLLEHDSPCYICGESAIRSNVWQYYVKQKSRTIEMVTNVCEKHTRNLI